MYTIITRECITEYSIFLIEFIVYKTERFRKQSACHATFPAPSTVRVTRF